MHLPLADIAELRSGSVPREGDGGALYLQARHVREGQLSTEGAMRGAAPARAAERARIVAGDVLVNARGAVNHAVAVGALETEAYASLDLILIRPDRTRLRADYLATYLSLPATQAALSGARTTAVLPRLSLDALATLAIPMPSLERQAAIAALAASARRERELLEQLAETRQRLLDEILHRAAEGAPMPSWRSAWASERLGLTAGEVEAVSTLANGDVRMPKSAGSGKGGGTRHVVPAPGGGWNNKRGGASRASSHHDTKQEAIDAARQQSRAEHSELKIHNLDGKIAQSDSHGHDPNPPKG